MRCSLPLLGFVVLATALPATAQVRPGDHGFRLVTAAGAFGPLCRRAPTCMPVPASATSNEVVTLEVRGPQHEPYFVFVSPAAQLCLTIPGIVDSLILSPPWYLLLSDRMTMPDMILACPGGLQRNSFRIPLPPSTSFSLQGVVWAGWLSGPQATFTVALDVTVR
jgi:hypothetical protein